MFYYWYYYLLSLLLISGLLWSMVAQSKISRNFAKYDKIFIRSGRTADELANQILRQEGLSDIRVTRCSGHLTDHYNPSLKTVSLSDSVYGKSTVSAVGVMAHELGHVLQYRDGYFPVKLRAFLVPVINFSNFFMWPLTILGLVLEFLAYTQIGFVFICIGIGIFALSTLFALVTIPVERDASRRAYNMLIGNGIIDEEDGKGVKKVLNSAGQTYVAALVTSILSLLRFVLFIATIRRKD